MKSNNEIPQYCRDLRLYFKLHKITRDTKYANKYKVQNKITRDTKYANKYKVQNQKKTIVLNTVLLCLLV